MKSREPRTAVLLPARLRVDGTWIDVRIRNVSSRGMLLEFTSPPPRGRYLEIARGHDRYSARVAWSDERTCGVQTREPISIADVTGQQPTQRTEEVPPKALRARAQARHVQVRRLPRIAELAAVASFAMLGAIAVGLPALDYLSATVQQALNGLSGRAMAIGAVATDRSH